MEVTVKKHRKPAIIYKKRAIVYKIAPSGNSKLSGRKIVRVAGVGDKNAFAGNLYSLEYKF